MAQHSSQATRVQALRHSCHTTATHQVSTVLEQNMATHRSQPTPSTTAQPTLAAQGISSGSSPPADPTETPFTTLRPSHSVTNLQRMSQFLCSFLEMTTLSHSTSTSMISCLSRDISMIQRIQSQLMVVSRVTTDGTSAIHTLVTRTQLWLGLWVTESQRIQAVKRSKFKESSFEATAL